MLGNNMYIAALLLLLGLSMPVWLQPAKAEQLTLVTYTDKPLVISGELGAEGVVVDVVKALMKRAGVDYKIKFMPPKRAIVMAKRTPKFCVFPISRSQEREAHYEWVGPVLISRHALYSVEKYPHKLSIMKDAKPLRIGSTLGDGVGEYLSNLGYKIDNTARNELNAEKLSLQRIDLWLSDTISAPYLAAKKGVNLSPPELVFFTTLRSMGCHKDIKPALIEKMTTALRSMYKDGSVNAIYKHLGFSFNQ